MTVGKGVLKPCGLAQSAQAKCRGCGHASPVAGRISVTLTGPAGQPDERLSDAVVVGIGTLSGLGPRGWASACSSNWYGSCELTSGQRPAPDAPPTG